jgi:hypothetical protein
MADPHTLYPVGHSSSSLCQVLHLTLISNKTAPFVEPYNLPGFVASRGYVDPTYPSDLPDSVRCGRGNVAHSQGTEILKVKAGDTLELLPFPFSPVNWSTYSEVPDVQWDNCPEGRGGCSVKRPNLFSVNHQGPVVVHLSRPPTGQDVRTYDGSGDWVKIHTVGLEIREDHENPVFWLPLNDYLGSPRFKFTLPKQTPEGQYLLRVDQIWPGVYESGEHGITQIEPQLYPACAQIEVESAISGDLPKGIKIPEGLSNLSPGMTVSNDQYYSRKVDIGYVYPGGPLWDGEKLLEDKAPST